MIEHRVLGVPGNSTHWGSEPRLIRREDRSELFA